MSKCITYKTDGSYLEEIENMEVCRWRINDVCCNDKSEDLGDYPYPREKCFIESSKLERCKYFEEEKE